MDADLNLGLIRDTHLTQLFLLFDHANKSFNDRESTAEFFDSIRDLLIEENHRRQDDRESEQHTVQWSHDVNDMPPVTIMCLMDFFRRKRREFEETNPPVSTFFGTFQRLLEEGTERYVDPELQRAIRRAQVEIRDETTSTRQ